MNLLLNHYLLNDLSLIVIEYVKFSDKQLSLLMNQTTDANYMLDKTMRFLSHDEEEQVAQYRPWILASSYPLKEDNRFSIVIIDITGRCSEFLLANTLNFSKRVRITQAIRRCQKDRRKPFHFHGSTIVVAEDVRVYDFDSDFT